MKIICWKCLCWKKQHRKEQRSLSNTGVSTRICVWWLLHDGASSRETSLWRLERQECVGCCFRFLIWFFFYSVSFICSRIFSSGEFQIKGRWLWATEESSWIVRRNHWLFAQKEQVKGMEALLVLPVSLSSPNRNILCSTKANCTSAPHKIQPSDQSALHHLNFPPHPQSQPLFSCLPSWVFSSPDALRRTNNWIM